MPTRKKMGHSRETVAKASKSAGTSKMPKMGSGKMGKKDSPMIHRKNKLSK